VIRKSVGTPQNDPGQLRKMFATTVRDVSVKQDGRHRVGGASEPSAPPNAASFPGQSIADQGNASLML